MAFDNSAYQNAAFFSPLCDCRHFCFNFVLKFCFFLKIELFDAFVTKKNTILPRKRPGKVRYEIKHILGPYLCYPFIAVIMFKQNFTKKYMYQEFD